MRSWMIAFSLGIFWGGYIPQLSVTYTVPLHLSLLIMPILSLRFRYLRMAGAFSLGLFWFLQWAYSGLEEVLPKSLENKEIWVVGKVLNLPQQGDNSQRFEFLISQICQVSVIEQCNFSEITPKKRKVLLNVYSNTFQEQAHKSRHLILKPEQKWRFKVKLKRPHGFANPGGFDYEAWLFQQRLSATGYVRNDSNNSLLAENTRYFSFQTLRYQFRERLKHIVEKNNESYLIKNSNLIKALSIGDRYNVTHKEWNLFTATGTNHLIVISGLHIGLVALLIYRLSSFLVSFHTSLSMNFPSRRFGAVFAVLAAFFYAGLAGFSLPTQRAFIMVCVFMLGILLCRNTSSANSFCLALAITLLMNPLAPQTSGFWLSFGAVGLLLMISRQKTCGREQAQPTVSRKISLLRKGLLLIKTQAYLCLGLLPLMLLFFQQTSLLAPLVNIIAIPFVGLLVVPLCLVGLLTIWSLPAFAWVCFSLADVLLSLFKEGLILASTLAINPLILLPALAWPALLLVISGALLLMFMATRTKAQKVIKLGSVLCFYPLFSSQQTALSLGEISVNILDVGQGLAIVINTQNHHLLYDTGPTYSARFEAGRGVVIPYIRAQNIPTLDKVIVSHGDNDHAGGLPALAQLYPDAEYSGGDGSIFKPSLHTQACEKGQLWQWDGVIFEILHPDNGNLTKYSSNNVSCVLKVTTGEYSVLLTGDIEKGVERLLLNTQKAALQADVLIASHHGSKTSSSVSFISAVKPEYVVFSSGYLNRFNHPHPDIVSRYSAAGVKMLNTASTGAIEFYVSAGEGVQKPLKWREERTRYWSAL